MNKKLAYAAAVLFLSFLASVLGCAPTTHHDKNYIIGREKSTNIGDPMISSKEMTLMSGGCLTPNVHRYTPDSFQEDLIYTGRSGSTIHMSYREYKQDFARPAFFQELRYDLSESQVIVFKRFTITVLEATNQFIRFRVDSDYSRSN